MYSITFLTCNHVPSDQCFSVAFRHSAPYSSSLHSLVDATPNDTPLPGLTQPEEVGLRVEGTEVGTQTEDGEFQLQCKEIGTQTEHRAVHLNGKELRKRGRLRDIRKYEDG